MINLIISTRYYSKSKLRDVFRSELESQVSLKAKQQELLDQGFVPMDPTLYTKVIDRSKSDREIVTVKIQPSVRFPRGSQDRDDLSLSI